MYILVHAESVQNSIADPDPVFSGHPDPDPKLPKSPCNNVFLIPNEVLSEIQFQK